MTLAEHELNGAFALTPEQIAFYRDNGYLRVKGLLSPALLDRYQRVIAEHVARRSADRLPIEKRTTYGKAFLQVGNLWQESEAIRTFVFGRRLAQVATQLIGATGVRIYHDQALCKEPGGGITPWHADQYYWPVASDRIVTAWVPLQDSPEEMGPLAFAKKSHRLAVGRDLEISDQSETTLREALGHFEVEDCGFELGEVSFHSGWTFHRAGANSTDRPREVMTIIYMDEDMRLAAPTNRNQAADAERWCPGVRVGEMIASPINPVIYSVRSAAHAA
jgi:ectoine hydroxylase-related dioxygenase (phytanoyl-CoA dioxygenase family)